tara:strand:- start:3158 stop:3571 length:414 start_codon:yes stop_codon:yes gene_type:complete
MTLFDWLNQILLHKKNWEDFDESEQKTFNTFMINRFLSMSEDFVDAVNICQEHTFQMEDKDVYNLYKNLIPKQKKFLRYIKGKKDKYPKKLLQFLAEHFQVSQREIIKYMSLLTKQDIEYLGKYYGKNKKQIKEMIK